MEITHHARQVFLETVWNFYAGAGRTDLPWRLAESAQAFDPYKIMLSEIMLQQTQVGRVIPKYLEFLSIYPNIKRLAAADLGDVLRVWQGLGYNRRARFVWLAAQDIQRRGDFPTSVKELVQLPGIGVNTAGAILAYAFNQPSLFIETNIRTVYIHHFFADKTNVHDADILQVLSQTIDTDRPRDFYWALMDYGTHLKTTIGNLNKASRQYTKQSKFNGSRRQVRGQVLAALSAQSLTFSALQDKINDARLVDVIRDLAKEELIRHKDDGTYHL